MADMNASARTSLSLLCALGGFVLAFIVGFYASFLFGANLHDVLPGVFGLVFGVAGGIMTFRAAMKKLA